ncbi:MAG: HepT-like ribonuclease domain-containing protein [Gammaproteobacteria bacterium]
MPSKNPAQRLRDILDNIDAVETFIAGITFEKFVHDRKTVYAVTRALEIISEASRRLPDELKMRRPEVDWPAVIAAGNVYRHEYDRVDDALIWHTAQHDLVRLREVAQAELQRVETTDASQP